MGELVMSGAGEVEWCVLMLLWKQMEKEKSYSGCSEPLSQRLNLSFSLEGVERLGKTISLTSAL